MASADAHANKNKAALREQVLLHIGIQTEAAKIYPKQKQAPPEVQECRDTVLVVDEDASHRELMATALGKNGYGCATAPSVSAARDILFAHPGIALIITDLILSEEDGYVLLNFVRKNLRFRHIPVIVASSPTSTAHVQKAIQMGARDFLAKPVSEEGVISRVRRVLEPRKGVILIVTDSEMTVKILKGMLSRGGYHLLEASSGKEAEAVLAQQKPSAIITELVLSDMTGLELLASVADRCLDIPVVFLADPHIHVVEEAIVAAGAHGLVRRPISGPELLRKIAALHKG